MASLICSESTLKQVQRYADQLHTLVSTYSWITESYVVEFFVKDHWGHLPVSWQTSLESLTPTDISETLMSNPYAGESVRSNRTSVWPLSLLAFRAATHALSLCRSVAQPAKLHPQSGRNPDLSHCYRAHVKPKKQHEIERLAEVIHLTCNQAGCHHVVDIGSGQGHLSRLLSFGYGHQVTSIEAVGCHITGAAKFDQEVKLYFERKAKGNDDTVAVTSPHHVICTVHPYITVEEFLSAISAHTSKQDNGTSHPLDGGDHIESSSEKSTHQDTCKKRKIESTRQISHQDTVGSCCDDQKSSCKQSSCKYPPVNLEPTLTKASTSDFRTPTPSTTSTSDQTRLESCSSQVIGGHLEINPGQDFLIAGLHTCGDLGPTMLRTFAECPSSVALASVACCYMRMSFCDKSVDMNQEPIKNDRVSPQSEQLQELSFSDVQLQHPGHERLATPSSCQTAAPKTVPRLDVGFPMSSHVRTLCKSAGTSLIFESLELACHFYDGYRKKLEGNDPSLLIQGYRAILEVLIQEEGIELTQSQDGARRIRKAVSSVKRAHQMKFEDYASAILSKLDLQSDPVRIRTLCKECLPSWHNLLVYNTIRQLLAPIVESLVLVDRALFLAERGIESRLVPIFDPVISPRNLVLLAVKKPR
ncbi:methyltransferase-like protein 25B [Asterias amurensis]|uniref:methyltransferase-like protein 25B n=1 Tax=Asterias amurensis TaxID=7602 RepID=UPI003AB1894E